MKNIVTIGGGSGSFVVLSALKRYPVHLSAIISMADDGGSTGMLRDQYGALPPGDIRRALVALSESSDTMRNLFNYRFENGGLGGHSFGNLFITALEKTTGSFASALQEVSNILNIDGEVVPVTFDDVRLYAKLEDGKTLKGETNIDIPSHKDRSPIEKIWLEPEARINPSVRRVLKTADLIIIGPGDLYTSVLPNFLVKGVAEEVRKSKAVKVYICNLMTKQGETDGYTGKDYLKKIEEFLGKGAIDYVIFNNKRPTERVMKKYRKENAKFVEIAGMGEKIGRTKCIYSDLLDYEKVVRHGPPRKLAGILLRLVKGV